MAKSQRQSKAAPRVSIGLLLLLSAGPLAGQTVRGRVIDAETGSPITAAALYILRADGRVERQGLSDTTGTFALTASRPGNYRLQAQRIGYTSATTESFVLREREGVDVELRMQVRGVPLEPLVIRARGSALERGRHAFERRCGLGKGHCLTADSIAARKPLQASDAFWGVNRIMVDYDVNGQPIIRAAGNCFSVLLNNRVRPIAYSNAGLGNARAQVNAARRGGGAGSIRDTLSLDEMLRPEDIAGIEIYALPNDIPKDLQSAMNADAIWPPARLGGRGPSSGRCGIAIVWTKAAW